MSRTASMGSSKNRPSPLSTKSFTRYEPPSKSPPAHRSRASTVQSPVTVKSPKKQAEEDVFEKRVEEEDDSMSPILGKSSSLPDKFDELPIELASLTDRFIESLSAKVYNEPPTADQLSELFQDFYVRAASSISIHISALMSKLNRDMSPASSTAGIQPKTVSTKQSTDGLASASRVGSSLQMLTASEVTEKRKARKLLEYKRLLLEEAVEKRACEKIYDKIWRHKSTLDDVRDEKLRSKTAALALVGIGLKDLGIEVDEKSPRTLDDIQESLTPAREALAKMSEEYCPLGKLQHLQTAHKAIVDTLYSIHPSGSSADEILPTLIYTLITSPIEGINIISNLYFVQRFRTASKIDGEAAYCMTNLEAAISFLEDVDLTSLRADEKPEGPGRTFSPPGTPSTEKLDPFPRLPITVSSPSAATTSPTPSNASGSNIEASTLSKSALESSAKPLPTPRHNRTLSDLLQPITTAPAAARSTAEESIKTITSTLDNSFKLLFGKLRERSTDDSTAEVIVPKTLDEARQLVSRPLTPEGDTISDSSSFAEKEPSEGGTASSKLTAAEEKILNLMGGRRRAGSLRDRSVDSQRSTGSGSGSGSGSGKRVTFTNPSGADPSAATASQRPLPLPTSNNPLDSVKNFTSNINPINSIGSAFGGAFRSFGQRTASSTTVVASPTVERTPSLPATISSEPEILLRPPTNEELPKIQSQAPIARFMAAGDASELKIGDVQELLQDYQRLARVIENLKIVAEEENS